MSVKKKRKGGSKKKAKRGKRGAARGSSAMRGAARRGLMSTHLGTDFPSYPAARSFAFQVKKALELEKVPAIRRVVQKSKTFTGMVKENVVYAVVTPITSVMTKREANKVIASLASKTKKKGKR